MIGISACTTIELSHKVYEVPLPKLDNISRDEQRQIPAPILRKVADNILKMKAHIKEQRKHIKAHNEQVKD